MKFKFSMLFMALSLFISVIPMDQDNKLSGLKDSHLEANALLKLRSVMEAFRNEYEKHDVMLNNLAVRGKITQIIRVKDKDTGAERVIQVFTPVKSPDTIVFKLKYPHVFSSGVNDLRDIGQLTNDHFTNKQQQHDEKAIKEALASDNKELKDLGYFLQSCKNEKKINKDWDDSFIKFKEEYDKYRTEKPVYAQHSQGNIFEKVEPYTMVHKAGQLWDAHKLAMKAEVAEKGQLDEAATTDSDKVFYKGREELAKNYEARKQEYELLYKSKLAAILQGIKITKGSKQYGNYLAPSSIALPQSLYESGEGAADEWLPDTMKKAPKKVTKPTKGKKGTPQKQGSPRGAKKSSEVIKTEKEEIEVAPEITLTKSIGKMSDIEETEYYVKIQDPKNTMDLIVYKVQASLGDKIKLNYTQYIQDLLSDNPEKILAQEERYKTIFDKEDESTIKRIKRFKCFTRKADDYIGLGIKGNFVDRNGRTIPTVTAVGRMILWEDTEKPLEVGIGWGFDPETNICYHRSATTHNVEQAIVDLAQDSRYNIDFPELSN